MSLHCIKLRNNCYANVLHTCLLKLKSFHHLQVAKQVEKRWIFPSNNNHNKTRFSANSTTKVRKNRGTHHKNWSAKRVVNMFESRLSGTFPVPCHLLLRPAKYELACKASWDKSQIGHMHFKGIQSQICVRGIAHSFITIWEKMCASDTFIEVTCAQYCWISHFHNAIYHFNFSIV